MEKLCFKLMEGKRLGAFSFPKIYLPSKKLNRLSSIKFELGLLIKALFYYY